MATGTRVRPHRGMVRLSGGSFAMGSEDFFPEERPVHEVRVDSFWIDQHPVTNTAFERFVRQTGYLTVAERTRGPGSTLDGLDRHPVTQVAYEDAAAYATWAGKRQFHCATVGDVQRVYFWFISPAPGGPVGEPR